MTGTVPNDMAARYLPPPEPTRRADGVRHHRDAVYAAVPGYRVLELDLWVPPAAPAPVVVWVHGGAWMAGNRRLLPPGLRPGQLFEELLAAGLAVATIEYRHAREAPFPAQLHDAKAAVRWLRQHADELGLDAGRVGIAGESAGGHLAALVGLTADRPELEGEVGVVGPSSGVDVVVDWYGVSSAETMPEFRLPPEVAAVLPAEALVPPLDVLLDGVDAATRAAVSPVAHAHAGAPPFLLQHGTADHVVPYAQSEQLAEALRAVGADVRLEPVPGATHGWDGYPEADAVVRCAVGFLAAALHPRVR
ncbi:Esterase/lipase-like protein [Modestobacter italicus]|uniref:Esterase/lipase-like protein n=1 Tax=Modestobacter italicus (strain DSM 44449 / CECT 9708 / BC 501) TaxID=2732864 RepID=I4EXS1_MODI5|nr:alpha/beta hydrolase [Modestobacter marinus]CCH88184.1 Esterase/lipase-like protein [Modestobacter marinus]